MSAYPDLNQKNKEAAFIHWFYSSFLGKQPDSTHYSSGTKILAGVFKASKKFPDVKVYGLTDAADLMYYLKGEGLFPVELTVIKFPNLLSAFVNKESAELKRIVEYLRTSRVKEKEWAAPDGW